MKTYTISRTPNVSFCWFVHEAIAAVVHLDRRHSRVDGRRNATREAVADHMNREMDDFFRFEAAPAPKGALR